MDDIFYEKALYRILQGRLRLTLGDLVLFIYEPDASLMEESFEAYDQAYKQAYFRGCFLKKELLEILVNNEIWAPSFEKHTKKIEEEIEDLKVEAFKSFYDTQKLRNIKMKLRSKERLLVDYKSKKHVLDHTSCEGVASFARSVWIISQTTFFKDGTHYDWSKYNISSIMEHYASEQIPTDIIRGIARKDPWRSMWTQGKKQGALLDKPSFMFTKDQLALCSFASMYDNVYEHPESPDEKVIDDDDCLDGWFIAQRRKRDKEKKKKQIEGMISNPKIANSQEVFVVAKNQQAANEIYSLNDPAARATIKNRQNLINQAEGEQISFTKFDDIRQDIAVQSHQTAITKMKGNSRR